jgi:hypothetical protein
MGVKRLIRSPGQSPRDVTIYISFPCCLTREYYQETPPWGREVTPSLPDLAPATRSPDTAPPGFRPVVIPSAPLSRRPGPRALRHRPGRREPAYGPSPEAILGCAAAGPAVALQRTGRGSLLQSFHQGFGRRLRILSEPQEDLRPDRPRHFPSSRISVGEGRPAREEGGPGTGVRKDPFRFRSTKAEPCKCAACGSRSGRSWSSWRPWP